MTFEQLPSDTSVEPAMELLDGDATAAPATGPSLLLRLARGTMYGVVLLAATALLAVSAVPELAQYATFLPDASNSDSSTGKVSACSSSCTTLDQVSFEESASGCCAAKAALTSADAAGGCCPLSAGSADESLVATTAEGGSCCATLSRASLIANSADDAGGCPLATSTEPIDAASLLATATAEEPAEDESGKEGTVLQPDNDEVEE